MIPEELSETIGVLDGRTCHSGGPFIFSVRLDLKEETDLTSALSVTRNLGFFMKKSSLISRPAVLSTGTTIRPAGHIREEERDVSLDHSNPRRMHMYLAELCSGLW